MKTLFTKFSRGKNILSDEGWYSLLKHGFSYMYGLFLSHGTYIIYEFDFGQHEISVVRPSIDCFYTSITNLDEYERLCAQGYVFGNREFRDRLNRGAIAFCVFVEKVLAAECWAATRVSAKNAVDPLPFHVDFENRVACSGVRFTNPRFRRNGFSVYAHLARLSYLKSQGFSKAKASVNVKNAISQATNEKYYGKKISKGRYLRIMGWQYWKETPFQ